MQHPQSCLEEEISIKLISIKLVPYSQMVLILLSTLNCSQISMDKMTPEILRIKQSSTQVLNSQSFLKSIGKLTSITSKWMMKISQKFNLTNQNQSHTSRVSVQKLRVNLTPKSINSVLNKQLMEDQKWNTTWLSCSTSSAQNKSNNIHLPRMTNKISACCQLLKVMMFKSTKFRSVLNS